MQLIETLLLDLDDTLLDDGFEEAVVHETSRVVAGSGTGLAAETLARHYLASWEEYWAEIGASFLLGGVAGTDTIAEVWRRALASAGVHDPVTAELATRTHRAAERSNYRLFDDVLPLLVAATAAGVQLGIVTNGAFDIQREKLGVLGLGEHFGVIAISSERRAAKPDSAIFVYALETLRADAATTAHVGDSLTSDVAGAHASGIRSVWLNRDGAAVASEAGGALPPDHVIRSLSELPALLGFSRA